MNPATTLFDRLIVAARRRINAGAGALRRGGNCLFANRFFTTRILSLSRNESDAILAMLFRHIETPEFSMRFRWQPNSIAFWDNRCAQRHALWDYCPNRRSGHRVTICGDRPY